MKTLFAKIRQRKTPFYAFLYKLAGGLRRLNMPAFLLPFYRGVAALRQVLMDFLRRMATFFYYEPMFRSRCRQVGKGLRYVKVRQGFPYFHGDIHIFIGDEATVHSRSSFSAASLFEKPALYVGDHTYLGPGLSIGVARRISIGSFCHVSSNVSITDNDGHPLDPIKRANGEPVEKDAVLPVEIGDHVWIGEGAIILKGVLIGEGAVIGTKSVVTRNVRPFTISAGNPATAIGKVSHVEALAECGGKKELRPCLKSSVHDNGKTKL